MQSENNSSKSLGIFISILVILLIAIVTIFLGKKQMVAIIPDQTSATTGTTSQSPVGSQSTAVAIVPKDISKKLNLAHKNGTYSATGSYDSPGGQDQLGVTVTLANDIITKVSITPGAGDNISEKYQNMFISGYKKYVVGKNIADVNLSKVSGSSLTPIGFNDALAQIKSQAKI